MQLVSESESGRQHEWALWHAGNQILLLPLGVLTPTRKCLGKWWQEFSLNRQQTNALLIRSLQYISDLARRSLSINRLCEVSRRTSKEPVWQAACHVISA
jgi:hypothetical protein